MKIQHRYVRSWMGICLHPLRCKRNLCGARDPIGTGRCTTGYDVKGEFLSTSQKSGWLVAPSSPSSRTLTGRKFPATATLPTLQLQDQDWNVCTTSGKLIAGVQSGWWRIQGGLPPFRRLDSSLVLPIAARQSSKPIRTFAIGMNEDAIDLKVAGRWQTLSK